MPYAPVNGINLYYEDTGQGFPLVWSHEFAGSCESWALQVQHFSRRYRVITYNARGYPPSDVPADPAAYSQDLAVEDLRGLLRHLGIQEAYIGGLSMGGGVALNFGLAHPGMARALIVAGAGTGATDPAQFREQTEEFARALEAGGMEGLADYVKGPTRVQLLRKNPRGLGGVRQTVRSPFGDGVGAHAAGRSRQAAHHLCSGGTAPQADVAHPDHRRRRG